MQHCPCKREIAVSYPTTVSADLISYNLTNTTCSRDTFLRGPGQKVVGFSLFGDLNSQESRTRRYFQGIAENLKLMHTFYNGWTMRLYFDLEDSNPAKKDICNMACIDPILDLCHAGHLPGTPMVDARAVFPMLWRFFPTLDPQVDIFVSRDLDSRFSWREASAVSDWLSSDEPIHSMRDHHIGHNVPLLGSAWGSHMLKKNVRTLWQKSWIRILGSDLAWKSRDIKGPDQEALERYVWPWAKNNSIQHDAYFCQTYSGSIAFPTQRLKEPSNHVAAVKRWNEIYWVKCPVQCRPEDHKDWETC